MDHCQLVSRIEKPDDIGRSARTKPSGEIGPKYTSSTLVRALTASRTAGLSSTTRARNVFDSSGSWRWHTTNEASAWSGGSGEVSVAPSMAATSGRIVLLDGLERKDEAQRLGGGVGHRDASIFFGGPKKADCLFRHSVAPSCSSTCNASACPYSAWPKGSIRTVRALPARHGQGRRQCPSPRAQSRTWQGHGSPEHVVRVLWTSGR